MHTHAHARTSSLSTVVNGSASRDTIPKKVSCPCASGAVSGSAGKRNDGGLSLASRTSTTMVTDENPVPRSDVVGTAGNNVGSSRN